MREIIARAVCVLTVGVVIALSFLFALAHNPGADQPVRTIGTPPPPAGHSAEAGRREIDQNETPPRVAGSGAAAIERGRAVYAQQNCPACHSIAEEGNLRHPLDGAGARWNARQLAEWVTGTGAAAQELPAAIGKRKQRYQSMSEEDLTALVAYLSSLKLVK